MIHKHVQKLAVVARDDQGQKIKAWTKEHFLCELVMVEAAAILCAVELATLEKFDSIIVEDDVKVCFDTLNGGNYRLKCIIIP